MKLELENLQGRLEEYERRNEEMNKEKLANIRKMDDIKTKHNDLLEKNIKISQDNKDLRT